MMKSPSKVIDKMDWHRLENQIYDLMCEFCEGHEGWALMEYLEELLAEHKKEEADEYQCRA